MIRVYTIGICGEGSRREKELEAEKKLLRACLGYDARICHLDTGAPVVKAGELVLRSISISHSAKTAVLAIGWEGSAIGVDIEEQREQLAKVAPRFLSSEEQRIYGNSLERLAMAWTLKEAAYKAAGISGVDLRTMIDISRVDTESKIDVHGFGKPLHVYTLNIGDEAFALVCDQSFTEVAIESIS